MREPTLRGQTKQRKWTRVKRRQTKRAKIKQILK